MAQAHGGAGQREPGELLLDQGAQRLAAGPGDLAGEHHQPRVDDRDHGRYPGRQPSRDLGTDPVVRHRPFDGTDVRGPVLPGQGEHGR